MEKDGYFLLSNFAGDVCLFYGRQALYKSGIGRSIKRITEHIVSSLTLDAKSGSLRLDEGISETSLEKRDQLNAIAADVKVAISHEKLTEEKEKLQDGV